MNATQITDSKEKKIAKLFTHKCSICGDPNAGWGYGVFLLKGKVGEWRCFAHRIDKMEKQASKIDEKKISSDAKPKTRQEQGSLF